jgi:class 3 adenylate cyclase
LRDVNNASYWACSERSGLDAECSAGQSRLMESTAFPERRRLAAILAIDMVAYSRQMRADEEGTLAALKAARQSIDPLIASAGGRIFKTTGDGLLCEFSSVVSALSCALAMQRALRAPGDDGPRFRIGVTLGDVVADGEDLYGDGVNMAARLQSVAQPGGIAVSRGSANSRPSLRRSSFCGRPITLI